MSVSKMDRLTVFLPHADAEPLLRQLMRLSCVSLTQEGVTDQAAALPPSTAAADAAARAARVDAVLPLLTKRSRRKKSLFGGATLFDPADFKRSGDEEKAWWTVRETEKILEQTSALKARIAEEEALMQSLLPYLDFKFALNDPGTRTAKFLLGSLPGGIKQERLAALGAEAGFVADVLHEDGSATYIAAVVHRKDEDAALRALGSLGFLRASLQKTDGRATAVFDAAQKRASDLRAELSRTEAQLDVLAENLTEVEILSDIEHTAHITEQNKQKLLATEKCAVLRGWCPADQRPRVMRVLDRFAAAYDFSPPAEDEEAPILLKNNPYARNFEWVLGMYSYPKYGKFDPTFIMSIFYFLIFGLMFADAGYGLVLSLACFGAVIWFEPREGMKRFLLMFGYCGISSMIWGVLFGSYFGNFPIAFMENVLHLAPDRMPNLAIFPSLAANVAILFDPLENPMGFLVVSLAVGAVHLLAGMAVRAYILCREGKPLDALLDIGSYWVLFGGIATVFFHKTAGIALIAGGVVAILATGGRQKKGVFGKIIGGFGGIYALVGYASDLLSYSRILALGLAAAVIAQVVNILATIKGASFVGFLLMIVVFTVGHLLNLVINVLGTFVHTSRLQYIEFFGRFYEDGGTPFLPMAASNKYAIDATDDEQEAAAEPQAEEPMQNT